MPDGWIITADFAPFIDLVSVPAAVAAQILLDYTNSGNAGSPIGLVATGDLTLTYTYDDGSDGVVVPMPAALPGGLALLGLLWLRRWRKA